MNDLTIQEAVEFTGLSRNTIMARIGRGTIEARKSEGGPTSPWLIPAGEVERVRRARMLQLNKKLQAISKPVPNGQSGRPES